MNRSGYDTAASRRVGKSAVSFLLLVSLLGVFGCAVVPKEAVDLSVTVGRDLAAIHRAHRELANRYFETLERDVQSFVDDVYRPYMIETTMADFRLVERVIEGAKPGAEPDALDVMELYVEEVSADIEDFRKTLLSPLRARRDLLLREIDDSYAALQNANAVVTGHLASVRKVHEEQDLMLAKLKLGDLRERVVDATSNLSDKIAEAIAKGRRGEEKLDSVAETLKRLVRE